MSRMDLHITKTLGDFETRLTEFQCSPHVCARSRQMQPLHQMYSVRRDPGLRSNKLTAPQPQGPMAQDNLMTTETRDEAPKTNNHGVPFYHNTLANNISKELHSGSILFWEESDMLTCESVSHHVGQRFDELPHD